MTGTSPSLIRRQRTNIAASTADLSTDRCIDRVDLYSHDPSIDRLSEPDTESVDQSTSLLALRADGEIAVRSITLLAYHLFQKLFSYSRIGLSSTTKDACLLADADAHELRLLVLVMERSLRTPLLRAWT